MYEGIILPDGDQFIGPFLNGSDTLVASIMEKLIAEGERNIVRVRLVERPSGATWNEDEECWQNLPPGVLTFRFGDADRNYTTIFYMTF